MELVVDDRERVVIKHLEPLVQIKIERITVGDYAFTYKTRLIATIERKTLSDLAASIKDGRMANNEKLLESRKKTNCQIIYIIEGEAYPKIDKKYNGIQYKCLQGKLDSLMFRHNISIIWTKDEAHTAHRLAGLYGTFSNICKEDKTVGPIEPAAADATAAEEIKSDGDVSNVVRVADETAAATILHTNRERTINSIHADMLNTLSGVSYSTARAVLSRYSIKDILTINMDKNAIYNLKYDSGFILGERGIGIFNQVSRLSLLQQIKILTCISGLTHKGAEIILNNISFDKIVRLEFNKGDIANIKKTDSRRIGISIEEKMARVFLCAPQ